MSIQQLSQEDLSKLVQKVLSGDQLSNDAGADLFVALNAKFKDGSITRAERRVFSMFDDKDDDDDDDSGDLTEAEEDLAADDEYEDDDSSEEEVLAIDDDDGWRQYLTLKTVSIVLGVIFGAVAIIYLLVNFGLPLISGDVISSAEFTVPDQVTIIEVPTQSQQTPLSTELLTLRMNVDLVGEMFESNLFALFMGLIAFILLITFKEGLNRADPSDFGIVMTAIFVALLSILIPLLEKLVFPGGQTLVLFQDLIGPGYPITMSSAQNFIALAAIIGLLGGAVKSGEKDLTAMSSGLYVAGFVFFAGKPALFMTWQLPMETTIAWALAFFVQFIEMLRQNHALVSLFITAGGAFLQWKGFLWLLGVLETSSVSFFVENPDVIAFVSSLTVVGLIISLLLGPAANQVLGRFSGLNTGDLAAKINSGEHDSLLYIMMISGIGLVVLHF